MTRKVLEIGQEDGRVIQPTGFDLASDGRFVVADVPRAQQRVQTFDRAGTLLTGFFLPGAPAARVIFGNLMLNGAGSVQHAGSTGSSSAIRKAAHCSPSTRVAALHNAASAGCARRGSKTTAICTSP